ncbi:MAG: class I SAM-dependent RNA methyltransferase [Gemmatimonadota bacterium]|nr:MAG: class I SAM-dependent RNA methyltransferase [Gemmatimonadota bacterium]
MAPVVLEIGSIIAGGDGLARSADGPVVFVSRSAPGDQVEVEFVESHRQWSRGRILRVITASADRCDAPCPMYATCAGCQLQHLQYAAQLRAKAGIVADGLRRLGGIERDPPEVVASPRELGYRNRISLILRRSGRDVIAGYHAFPDASMIADVQRCPLAEDPINSAWAALRRSWGDQAERLPAGDELRLTLRANAAGEVGLSVAGGSGYGEPDALLGAVDNLVSIWGLGRDGEIEWYSGEPRLSERWGEHSLELAGNTFLQVNREVAACLEPYVLDQCGQVAGQQIVDAYCGFGARALELAWKGARVVGIDSDRETIASARRGAVESGAAARFVAERVERALARELPAHTVLLNPPRRGVDRPVIRALLEQPPSRIVYVSCDPATLARDLKALAVRYELKACRAFDMFPQTAHVETVVTLVRS